MPKRRISSVWSALVGGRLASAVRASRRSATTTLAARACSRPLVSEGLWFHGTATGPFGERDYRLYRPSGARYGEKLPLVMMLHGCGQDATSFAESTRMNAVAAREGFMVLYPEQDRVSNSHGCWNWFETLSGKAFGEAAVLVNAIDQVGAMHGADRSKVAVAGLSSGASMAALLATRYPERFRAVIMHSGIPPGTATSAMSALSAMRGYLSPSPLTAMGEPPKSLPPLLVIHGGNDKTVTPSNGVAAVRVWAEATGAVSSPPMRVERGQRYAANVTKFKRKGKTLAALVDVAELGHAWSGGAANQAFSDELGPDASRMVWTFAAKQFRA